MPELPEVETIALDLIQADLIGQVMESVIVYWERSIAKPALNEFKEQLRGQSIQAIGRRGKYLKITLSAGETLLIHLRMTGRLQLIATELQKVPYARVVFILKGGVSLVFSDPRKFGRLYLLKNPEDVLGKLGPEPLGEDFTEAFLKSLLASKSRQLKPALLDQSLIAGLGNIYVDEALWLACLHPLRITNSLQDLEIVGLHRAIRQVLERGLKAAGTTLGSGKSNFYRLKGERGSHQNLLQVFRQTGKPCPRCQTAIQRQIVGMRSSHFCPHCQREV